MTGTVRLILQDSEALRQHLDDLNERGQDPVVVGVDSTPQPFLITLVGPYAEGELVLFDSPWNSDAERTDSIMHCEECRGRENSIDHLSFPVTILVLVPEETKHHLVRSHTTSDHCGKCLLDWPCPSVRDE